MLYETKLPLFILSSTLFPTALADPIVKGNPVSPLKEGSTLTLICSSIGYPSDVTYMWYKGTAMVATTLSYAISGVSRSDAGNYSCIARNLNNNKTSGMVQIKIACKY